MIPPAEASEFSVWRTVSVAVPGMDDAGEHAAPTARVPPHEADDSHVDSREPEAGPGHEGAPSDSLKQGLSVSETTSGPAGNIATSVSVLDKASCLACTSNRKKEK